MNADKIKRKKLKKRVTSTWHITDYNRDDKIKRSTLNHW